MKPPWHKAGPLGILRMTGVTLPHTVTPVILHGIGDNIPRGPLNQLADKAEPDQLVVNKKLSL